MSLVKYTEPTLLSPCKLSRSKVLLGTSHNFPLSAMPIEYLGYRFPRTGRPTKFRPIVCRYQVCSCVPWQFLPITRAVDSPNKGSEMGKVLSHAKYSCSAVN